jgi:hypothetical protein
MPAELLVLVLSAIVTNRRSTVPGVAVLYFSNSRVRLYWGVAGERRVHDHRAGGRAVERTGVAAHGLVVAVSESDSSVPPWLDRVMPPPSAPFPGSLITVLPTICSGGYRACRPTMRCRHRSTRLPDTTESTTVRLPADCRMPPPEVVPAPELPPVTVTAWRVRVPPADVEHPDVGVVVVVAAPPP